MGDKGGEASTLNNIGRVYADLEDKSQALDYYEQSLQLSRQVGDKGGEATTLNNIGSILWQEGRAEEVVTTLQQIVTIAQEIGDIARESAFRANLAAVLSSVGRNHEAVRNVEISIELLESHHLPQDSFGQTLDQERAFLAQLSGEPSPQAETITLDQLSALVVQARQGDANLAAQLMPDLQQLAADDQQDRELRRFFNILTAILAGDDSPNLSDLPAPLTKAIEGILAALDHQRSD